jgi:hypothetical protein
MVDNYSRVFDRILELAGIEDTTKPLAVKIMVKKGLGYPIKDGLLDPENKALQLILWLYSIEPSLQEDLTKVCLEMDEAYLDTLGPYAAALYTVFQGAEYNRKDKLVPGIQLHNPAKDLHHDLGTFASSHVVFRGTQLAPEWIEDWRDCVDQLGLSYFDKRGSQKFDADKPGNIFLQGNTSTTE